MSRRAKLRKRALVDYQPPELTGPHGLGEDLVTLGLPIGGIGAAAERIGGATGRTAGQFVARGVQRRVAMRAAEAASERRLAEMAAPRATRTLQARGGGLFTDINGTPLDPQTAFNEGHVAVEEMTNAIMDALKKVK